MPGVIHSPKGVIDTMRGRKLIRLKRVGREKTVLDRLQGRQKMTCKDVIYCRNPIEG